MSKDGKTWIAPKVDTFDGRAFYAAKSATDGNKRYLFGWIPTKDNNDYGNWHWGGSLAVHEIYQGEDGCLYERMPKSVYESFTEVLFESKEILIGNLNGTSTQIFADQPSQFLLECDIEADDFASKYGLLISYAEDTDQGYAYSIDNHAGSFNLSEFPNTPWRQANFINVNRKLESKKTYKLQLIFEDNVAVAYLDEKYALSIRLYPENKDNLKFGLLSNDGLVKFKNLVVKIRK